MTIHDVATLFSEIEKTPKRLEMQALLTTFLGNATPEEAAIVVYLLIGRIVPEFIAVEFQLSDKTLRAVVEALVGRDIGADLTKYGDIGSVWEHAAVVTPADMALQDYYQELWAIAGTTGTGSQKKKQDLIATLLKRSSPLAGKYTLRILNSKLRLGASERTILEALGKMPNGNIAKLKELFGDTSDIGHTVYLFRKYAEKSYEQATFSPGVPVSAKLVEREDSIEAIFKRIPAPIEEPKYDGLRIQIHVFRSDAVLASYADRVWKDKYEQFVVAANQKEADAGKLSMFSGPTTKQEMFDVMLFSRNLENMTNMFPEVVAAAKQLPEQYEKKFGGTVSSLVLDGEVIGYNDLVEEYLPFQQTMTRKRKHDVGDASGEVPVKVFSFDVLLVNGDSLMQMPLRERKEKLRFLDENKDIQKTIVKTPVHYPQTIEEANKIFETYIAEGLEGVIFKGEDTIYTPGVRNFDWLKFKRAMRQDLADTVDVVLLGYYRGEGKLSAFGIGALLAGLYDKKSDRFLTVTKIGTGITHEQWQSIKLACDEVKTDRHLDNVIVPNSLIPDVWLLPTLVVEVEADEITKSPLHSSGYALRFPRFKKFRDKKPEDATTIEELAGIKG